MLCNGMLPLFVKFTFILCEVVWIVSFVVLKSGPCMQKNSLFTVFALVLAVCDFGPFCRPCWVGVLAVDSTQGWICSRSRAPPNHSFAFGSLVHMVGALYLLQIHPFEESITAQKPLLSRADKKGQSRAQQDLQQKQWTNYHFIMLSTKLLMDQGYYYVDIS